MRRITRSGIALGLATAAAVLTFSVPGCGHPENPWPANKSLKVLATFPPLACFAQNVAGEDAAVLSLLTNTGPHDYQTTARDALLVRGADVFLINGLGLDDFARTLSKTHGPKHQKLVALGEGIDAQQLRKLEGGVDEHGHQHGSYDPHVWLGIPEAVKLVERIRDTLKEIDRDHAANYDRRAAAYVERLKNLHAEGKQILRGKSSRQIFTFHESLHYFAQSFDLKIAGVITLRPGEEPNPQTLSALVNKGVAENVRVVAVEPQYPDNTAAKALLEGIQNKLGGPVQKVVLDPLETAGAEETQDLKWFETKMLHNLNTLAKALPDATP